MLGHCRLQRLGAEELLPEFLACSSAQNSEKGFREAAVITVLRVSPAARHMKDVVTYGACMDWALSVFLADKP